MAHRWADEDVRQHYVKKTAGPYSPWSRYGGPEGIAIKKRYVRRAKVGKYEGLIADANVNEIDQYLDRYPICQAVKEILNRFQFEKNDELELFATVDFAALDLAKAGKEFTSESVRLVIADNPEWAPKLDREIFSKANICRALKRLRTIFPKFYLT